MNTLRKLTRREFLTVSTLAAASALVAACRPQTPPPTVEAPVVVEKPAATTVPAAPDTPEAKYKEAPELAALVAAGQLPPVDERLPLEPFVVGPGVLVNPDHLDWEVGDYSRPGEVLRSVTISPTWSYPCQHAIEHILNTWTHHTGPITGNLCSSWSVNDDCTEYEFTLRRGLKWSDGVPVTTEDIRFTYEDFLMNERLTPVIGANLRSRFNPAGEPMKLKIIDDYTFTISFTESNGRFLTSMGVGNLWNPYNFLLKPKHYLEKFHEDYADDAELSKLCQDAGLGRDEWHRLLLDEGGGWWGGGCEKMAEEGRMPTLRGWTIKPSPEELIIMERNPYYHKVDIEGKQLPYVGRIEGVVVSDPESIPMAIINGEANYVRERLQHTDISLYLEHAEANNYKVKMDLVYHNAPVALYFNMNNPNENWRQIVWQKEFRHAVNAAIDYREIIDVLFLGMGTVCPWIPDINDKAEANRLLDAVGLDQRDRDGWRLYPDGSRFQFEMDIAINPLFGRPAEVIKTHLEEVGIYCTLRQMEGSLWTARRDANELYAAIDWCDDCNWPYLIRDYHPTARIRWAQLWHLWMQTRGEEGEEPPDWMKELYDLDHEMSSINPDTSRAERAEERFAAWFMEHVPILPLARDVVDPCIVPVNAANVGHAGRSSAIWFKQEQVFFKHS